MNHADGATISVRKRATSTSVRRILTCVLGLQFFVQASGVDAILLYSPLVSKAAGIASTSTILGATVAMGAVKTKTSFILVGTLLTDRLGRRPLLLTSTAAVAATTAALAVTLYVSTAGITSSPAMSVVAVLAVVASYSVGCGSVMSAYSAEVLPLRLRAQGSSMAVAVNRITGAVVGMTFISLASEVTMAGCFLVYAAAMAAGFVFVYACLPETKGRSLEDMDVLFCK